MDQLKKLYSSLSPLQRVSILISGILIAIGVAWFSHWQRESGFRPLFSSLNSEDAAAIVQKLKESGVEYRLESNGTVVLVPEAKVAELRLQMAGSGLPKTGRIGFEIFDKTNFGMSDFAEHVNFRRAIEGELERSVMSIAEIEQARVHVTFAKDSVFLDQREPAKASVLVRLRAGAMMLPQNVAAITHLVSSAVEGLSPAAVSVVDMQGNLLNRPKRLTSADGDASDEALDYQQKVEHELQVKINNTLEPLLGPDKFRTAVSAECDMTSGDQSEEIFDPTKSVMVTSQRTEDVPGVTTIPSGQPGTASNLPSPPERQSGTVRGSSRRVENVTYQSSRTVRHLKLPQGVIKHLSVSVLLDQGVRWEGKAPHQQRVLVPPSPEMIKTIHDVVATTVALNAQRGDQLVVETLPFDSTMNAPPPEVSAPGAAPRSGSPTLIEQLKAKPVLLWGGLAALIILIGAAMLLRRRRRPTIVVEQAPVLAEAAQVQDRVSLANHDADEAVTGNHPLQLPASPIETLNAKLKESVQRDAEVWANIIRGWLSEEEGA